MTKAPRLASSLGISRAIGTARALTPGPHSPSYASDPATPGRAHAPGLSPAPSRSTPYALGARPLTGLPSGREAASLPAAEAQASDAARIAAPCSAPATPEAAGVSATRGDAPDPANLPGTATKSSTHLHTFASPPPTHLQDGGQRGRRFVVTAVEYLRAGLIEKQSIRPAAVPAGTTQGRTK